MTDLGVARLVATSAYGMVATKPYLLAGLVRRIFANAFADQSAADEVIEALVPDRPLLDFAAGIGNRSSQPRRARHPPPPDRQRRSVRPAAPRPSRGRDSWV
jgi:hypothetical protein